LFLNASRVTRGGEYEGKSEEEYLSNSTCKPSDVGSQQTSPGIITGIGPSVLNAAAFAYGSHEIGNGIGESGDDNSTDNSVTQGDYNTNGDRIQTDVDVD